MFLYLVCWVLFNYLEVNEKGCIVRYIVELVDMFNGDGVCLFISNIW